MKETAQLQDSNGKISGGSCLSRYMTAMFRTLLFLLVAGMGARASDPIDPAVGLTRLAGIGAEVSAEAPLALVHARDEASAAAAIRRLGDAYRVGDAPPAKLADPVVARIGGAA